jgi:membrane protein DedA with SNARE-associated domain
MKALPPVWAYLTLLVIAYGENVMPPIPGDMVVVFGGYMAGLGLLDLGMVIVLSTVGGALGFMSMYAIGYRLGRSVLQPGRLQWLPQEQFETAQRWIRRYGYGVVAANRFLSGARSVISLTVGMAQMSPWKTFGWCTVSAAVWTGLISYAGYSVGENWEIVVTYLRAYGRTVLVLLILAAAATVAYRVYGPGGADDDGGRGDEGQAPTDTAPKAMGGGEGGNDIGATAGRRQPPTNGSGAPAADRQGEADRKDEADRETEADRQDEADRETEADRQDEEEGPDERRRTPPQGPT